MKVNFSHVLKAMDGTPMKDGERVVTLGTISINVLLLPDDESQKLTGQEKVERFQLATKIHAAGEDWLDISVEQVALIKTLIGRLCTIAVVGQVWPILESQPRAVNA